MPLDQTPKAVIFDMDGLLFNTEELRIKAVQDVGEQFGLLLDLAPFMALIGGASAQQRQSVQTYLEQIGLPHFWMLYRNHLERRMASELALKRGAAALLAYLEARKIPKAIATSARRENVDEFCARFAIGGHFQAIVAKGDYERPKPAPDAFLAAAKKLDCPPERCLALEDSPVGVSAAWAAGMKTIMVRGVVPPTEKMRSQSICILANLDEAHELLAGLEKKRQGSDRSVWPSGLAAPTTPFEANNAIRAKEIGDS